jgi:hypothetical protein
LLIKVRFVEVEPPTLDGKPLGIKAIMCARYSDHEYRNERLKGDTEEFHKRYGK